MRTLLSKPLLLTGIIAGSLLASVACQRTAGTSAESKNPDKKLNAYWTELTTLPATLPRRDAPMPDNYRLLRLDLPALRKHLAATEASEGATQTIEMPLPIGKQESFVVTTARVMAPELASRYPGFRNYKGTATADPTSTIRFDLSDMGFKARINSGADVYLIDPYMPGDTLHYVSYLRPQRAAGKSNARRVVGQPERLPESSQ